MSEEERRVEKSLKLTSDQIAELARARDILHKFFGQLGDQAVPARASTGCTFFCSGSCVGDCDGECKTTCLGSCSKTCSDTCRGSCYASCKGDCVNTSKIKAAAK